MNAACGYAVVGAGLAGLSVATQLRKHGASVIVLEARDRVGGRILSSTWDDVAGGQDGVLDLGAQWVGPEQIRVMGLIKEFGLTPLEEGTPGSISWSIAGKKIVGGSRLPKVGMRTRLEILSIAAAVRLMYPRLPPDAPWSAKPARRWDRGTAKDWIRRLVRTPEGIALAEIYVRGNTASELSETSIYALITDVRGCGTLGNVARAETFRIAEGAFEIPHRLSLPLADSIHLRSPVRAISQDSDGVTVESDTITVRCRRTIVCVPAVLAREIAFDPPLPQPTEELFANTLMGSCIKFHASYDSPFWRSAGLNGTILSNDHAVSLTYDSSPRDGSGLGSIVGFVLGDRARRMSPLPQAEREAEILSSLREFFGASALQPAALVVQDWNKEEWSRGAYSAHYPPGVLTKAGAALWEACDRVHWAGTETSLEWTGYMEGAVRSADRVVREILAGDYAR
jgi:monoamine oxidase